MSIFETIVNHLNEHIDATSSSIESLTPYIAEAAHLCAHTLLTGNKIFTAGNKFNQAIISQLCINLQVNSAVDRPSLPIMNLEANLSSFSLASSHEQQLQTFANKGDLFIAISDNGKEEELINAVSTAKQNALNIILINAGQNRKLPELIPDEMVIIQLPELSTKQAASLQFLIVQLLSELIELQLFPGLSE